jgi:hypothetical protein
MSRPRVRDDLVQNVFGSERAIVAVAVALLALLAYGVLLGRFLVSFVVLLQVAVGLLVLFLFYRLVLAVEHIAYED